MNEKMRHDEIFGPSEDSLHDRVELALKMNDSITMAERLIHPDTTRRMENLLRREGFPEEHVQKITDIFKRRVEMAMDYDIVEKKNVPIRASSYTSPSLTKDGYLDMMEPGKIKLGRQFDEYFRDEKSRDITIAHERNHAVFVGTPLYWQNNLKLGFSLLHNVRHFLSRFESADLSVFAVYYLGKILSAGYFSMPARRLPEAYLLTNCEILARMGQLKNFFGIKDGEEFTAAHLEYARKYYVSKTGFDNAMHAFLKGISRRREARFLELMNTWPV